MRPHNSILVRRLPAFEPAIQLCLFIAAFLLFSCQKEEPAKENNAIVTDESALSKYGKPDIVVHKGSSIQDAIDQARSGDVISIEPGVYKEAIVISKPGIKLVGRSEQAVVIENPGDEEDGIRVTDDGDDFTLSNMTIKGFKENGVFLIRVTKYLISHVTTIDNGEYGLFPLFCQDGVIEHCVAIGHSDTGIYIGQSEGAELKFNKAYENVNGIEVENCTNVVVTKNQCYNNTAGILAVVLPGLTVKELKSIQIIHNHVYDNNHPNFAEEGGGFEGLVPSGSGILFVGGDNSLIEDNNVKGNNFVGIAVVSTLVLGQLGENPIPPEAFADIEPLPNHVKVISNVVMNNGAAPPKGLPLPGVDLLWDGSGIDNCWQQNHYKTSFPETLPTCQ